MPLGYVVYMTVATGWDTAVGLIFRARVGELLLNTVWLELIAVPLCLVARRRRRLARRAHPAARAPVVGLALAAPLASPPSSTATAGSRRSRRSAGSRAACSSRCCPTSRSSTSRSRRPEPPRPGPRGVGRLPRARPVRRSSCRVVLPQLRLAMTGRRAARRPAPARRVRRLRDDPLRHLHDGDHGAVPVDLQRRRRQHARQRARRPLPAPARRRGAQPGHRALRPRRLRRAGSAGAVCRWAGSTCPRTSRSSLLVVLAVGVPLWFVVRWVVARRLRRSGCRTSSSRPCSRRCATAWPVRWRRPSSPSRWRCSPCAGRAGSPARSSCRNYITSSMPGIVVGLAFVTVSIRAASPGSTRRRSSSSPPTSCSSCPARSSACGPGSPRRRASSRRPRRRSGARPFAGVRPGHAAPLGAGGRRRGGARLPRHRQRADRDPAALAQRHAHARDRVLGEEQRDRLRRRGPLRPAHGACSRRR